MKIYLSNFFRWYPVLSLVIAFAMLAFCTILYKSINFDDRAFASLIGVQHMGSDYRINRFYVDEYGGGNVGEEGGGGGIMCCVKIPRQWHPGLKARVRWEVDHIIRTDDPKIPKIAEVSGIYHAQVPVEAYIEPGHLYVHFFSGGGVRIVVSKIGPGWDGHPIQWEDTWASQTATMGTRVSAIFSDAEIAASEREAERDRKKNGDWR